MFDFPTNLKSKITMYADDTQALLSFSSTECQVAKALLQDDLDTIFSWSVNNYLILNAAKTILIIIDPSGKLLDMVMFSLSLNNIEIIPVTTCKTLGLTIDHRWLLKSCFS